MRDRRVEFRTRGHHGARAGPRNYGFEGGGSSPDLLAENVSGPEQETSQGAANEAATEENLENLNTGVENGGNEAAGEAPEADLEDSKADVSVPAGGIVNQEMPLNTVVAQAESTRSFFLAQTLESTKTVPVVSAKLPLDTNSTANPSQGEGFGGEIAVLQPIEGATDEAVGTETDSNDASEEGDGSDGSDESDLGSALAPESVIVGAFERDGITYAVEPGGETVAVIAIDPAKLPEECLEDQAIVLPSAVGTDDIDLYSVTRIADRAFAALHVAESANAETSTEDATTDILAIAIPASVSEIGDDAFTGADMLQYVAISPDNQIYGSYNGCLYDAELTNLLLIPEGRQGAVRIPSTAETVDTQAFSHCASVQAIFVDEGSAAFSSRNGLLYDAEGTTLLRVPAGVETAIISEQVSAITEGAFEGCEDLQVLKVDDETTMSLIEGYAAKIEYGNTGLDSIVEDDSESTDVFFGNLLSKIVPSDEPSTASDPFEFESEGRAVYDATSFTMGIGEASSYVYYKSGFVTSSSGFTRDTVSAGQLYDYNNTSWYQSKGFIYVRDNGGGTGNYTYYIGSSYSSTRTYYYSTSASSTAPRYPIPTTESTPDSTTVYVWTTAGYVLTWDGNGATPSKTSETVSPSTTTSVPTLSGMSGWTFGGWYTNSACTGTAAIAATATTTPAITATTTYYAKWTRDVTFYYQDGATETTQKIEGLKDYGASVTTVVVTTPATKPVRSGWSFAGWSDSRTGTTVYQAEDGTTDNINVRSSTYALYARWKMTLNLDDSNGSGTTGASMTLLNSGTSPFGNAAVTIPLSSSKKGHTFMGWFTAPYGSGEIVTNGATSDIPENKLTGETTIYSHFSINSWTITWKANGGSAGDASESDVDYDTLKTVYDPGVISGYAFTGWTASGALSGTYQIGDTFNMPDGDVTFTATWDKSPYYSVLLADTYNGQTQKTVYYWPEQGFVTTASSTDVIPQGGTLVTDAPIGALGYEFLGYYKDQSNTDNSHQMISADGKLMDATALAAATTWYAHWRPLVYTLNFANAEDHGTLGSVSATFTIENKNVTLPSVSAIERGYEFEKFTTSGISFTEDLNAKAPGDAIQVQAIDPSWTESTPVATVSANYRLHTYGISYDIVRYKNAGDTTGIAVANPASGNPTSYQYDPTQTANTVTVSNAPTVTKAGYVFKGWYCPTIGETEANAGFPKTIVVDTAFVLQDLKLQAAYELVEHTVTLDATTGGSLVSPGNGWAQAMGGSTYTYAYTAESEGDATRLLLPNASKPGYTFVGYSGDHVVKDASDGRYYFTLQFTSDASKASFSYAAAYSIVTNALTVQVVFDDGAPQASTTVSTYTTRSDVSASFDVDGGALEDLTGATKHAYRFIGWTADTNCLVDSAGNALTQGVPAVDARIAAGLTSTMVNAPKTVYAHFTYATYPLYVSTGDAKALLSAPNWNIVTDASELASIGLGSTTAKVYKYAHGYTLADGAIGITIPEPSNQGMKFNGWTDSAALTHGYELSGDLFKPTSSPTADAIGYRLFTAKWVDAPYTITFENIDHVVSIDIETTCDAAISAGKLTLKNSQLDAGVKVAGVTVDPDFYHPTYGFQRFVAEGVDLSALGWIYERGSSFTSDAFELTYDNITKYFPNGADALTIRLEFNTEDIELPDGTVVSPIKHYTASLDLAGGAIGAADAAYWGDELKMDFTHETSGDIVLPTPTRTGFTFAGWTGAYDDPSLGVLPNNGLVGTTYQVIPGSVHDRTYTAHWTPKTTNVKFVYNAMKPDETYIDVPAKSDGTGFAVTYGRGMNDIESIAGREVPTRPGYRFLGFFDTSASSGGKQYYTSTLASARVWDKDEPGVTDYTLYARWTKVDDPDNIRVIPADPDTRAEGYITARPDSRASAAGTAVDIFDAVYTGVYAWDTYEENAARPSSSETVTIDVSSYTYNSGFNICALPKQFDYTADGKNYRLLGFYVGSGKNVSIVKYTDLLYGYAFQLKVSGGALVLTGAGSANPPSFVVNPDFVTPFYTTGDPGYSLDDNGEADPTPPGGSGGGGGDDDPNNPGGETPPAAGDVIVTYFSAGEGTFPSINKSFTMTETVYRDASTRPNLPEDPVRAGYRFVGWSTEEDHMVGDGCSASQSALDPIVSKAPRTYYAHYEAKSSSVDFVEVEGKRYTLGTVIYGSYLPALGSEGGVPMPAEREGYVFKGYFDTPTAASGKQYINDEGQPTRAWDVDAEYATLYAYWVKQGGDQEMGGTSKPTEDPDPDDPFPGVDEPFGEVPTKITSTDPSDIAASRIKIPVQTETASLEADLYAGRYDGAIRYTDTTGVGYPATADDNVEVTVFSYVPDPIDGKTVSALTAHERIRAMFEAVAPAETPYLQGFTVLSTGWNISVRDLHDEKSIVIRCMGDDLEWTYDGKEVTLASAVFKPGRVVAVYSATPVIDPGYDWPTAGDPEANPPIPATQVFNRFNAGVGRFYDEAGATTVECTLASSYGASLTVPADPAFPYLGYEFDGWYLNGEKVDPAACKVDWTDTRVFYARYRQVTHTVTLKTDPTSSTVFGTIEAWHGQSTDSLALASYVPQKSGYEFAGWYEYDGNDMSATGSAKPYYLASSTSPNSHLKVESVTKDVTLLPYWRSRTYTINWVYNHGSFDLHDTTAVTWNNVGFNEPIGRDFPVPSTPRFGFCGWYATSRAGLEASGYNDNADILGEDNYFVWDDAAGDWIFRPAPDKDASTINIYAGWSKTPVPYVITLLAGEEHGATFENGLTEKTVSAAFDSREPDAAVDIYLDDCLPEAADAGWRFAGWKEVGTDGTLSDFKEGTLIRKGTGDRTFIAQWAIEVEGGYSIEFVLGEEVNTSVWGAPDYTTWYYETDEDNRLLTTAFDASTELVEVPRFTNESITGYDFAGWQRVVETTDEAGNAVHVPVEGSGLDTIDAGTSGFAGQRLVQIAADESRYADEPTTAFVFKAVWVPKTFQIRYFVEKGGSADDPIYEQMSSDGLADDSYAGLSYNDPVVLPYPAFREVANIFEHWDGKNSVTHTDLVAGASGFTVKELIAKVGESNVERETADDGSGAFTDYLNLYAVCSPSLTFSVPIKVNIAFDLDDPVRSMVASDAMLQTVSNTAVRVESIELQRLGADDAFKLDDEAATDGSSLVDLLVQAYRAEDRSDIDPEAYLAVNMGAANDGRVYRDLAANGFGTFTRLSPLRLDYALRFADGAPKDLNAFANLLSIRDDDAASIAIAQLFYTVGLA